MSSDVLSITIYEGQCFNWWNADGDWDLRLCIRLFLAAETGALAQNATLAISTLVGFWIFRWPVGCVDSNCFP